MPRAKREFVARAAAGAEIVSLASLGLELSFAPRRRTSEYDALLERLLDAPKGSVLKVARPGARATIVKRAQKKDLQVEFAEAGGALYVRIVPNAPGRPPSPTPAAPREDPPLHKRILEALMEAPETAVTLARRIDVSLPMVKSALAELVKKRRVQQDGGGVGAPVYRAKVEKA